ncbi:MAG: hypothetical protein LBC37_07665 [Zoogloeaceae bacterium]|jgi:hypothetical protein|nr:hypothetical protein [Zoogloeaceae bacterium]
MFPKFVLAGALVSFAACVLAEPDATDRVARLDLGRMVEAERVVDTEFALERVLERLSVELTFHAVKNPEDHPESISLKEWLALNERPEDITQDEWRALQGFFCPERKCGGLFWSSSEYALFDLDGNGQRDLVYVFYDGGSGYCTDHTVWRRQKEGFEKKSDGEYLELFTICTRGSGVNTRAYWIRLRGKLYAALVYGRTGLDRVRLLRPFPHGIQFPDLDETSQLELRVFYRYRLEDDAGQIAGDFRESLEQALNAVVPRNDENARDDFPPPLCPIPENASEEERIGYQYGYGDPWTWEFESIIFPLWWNGECHVVSTMTQYGWYDRNEGLQFSQEGGSFLSYPELPEAFETLWQIKARRETLRVE